jgi:hypothetical protein
MEADAQASAAPSHVERHQSRFFSVYIPSFAEFCCIPELMGGDKYMFVGSVVSHYILGDQTGSLGAAFTVVACVCLLLSAAGLYYVSNKTILLKRMKMKNLAWRDIVVLPLSCLYICFCICLSSSF